MGMKPIVEISHIPVAQNPENRLHPRGRIAFLAILLLLPRYPTFADVVIEWNAVMETTVAATDPAAQVRSATITQVAVFEAVNSVLGQYEPYLGLAKAPAGTSPEAAAIAAAHRVLTVLHPEKAAHLDARRAASLAPLPAGPARETGIATGVAAADALLARRAHDGFDQTASYTPGTKPGEWQPTPPDLTPAFRPGLGRVAPFVIAAAAEFRASPPPALASAKYARDYQEVKAVGAVNSHERSPERMEVARFYEITDALPIYFPAARQVSGAQGRTLSENARNFALLAMAIFDGAVACFETKYHYNVWRPVTAIRAGDVDGNRKTEPDFAWQSLVFTPPFPSYPSGHASFGAAARRVLEHVFGEDGHAIILRNPQLPGVVLHYTAFEQITDDIDDARIYGGVHYRFDQEAGARQGRRIGAYIVRHALRPVRDNPIDAKTSRAATPGFGLQPERVSPSRITRSNEQKKK
jgi:hypothetical protein